MLLPIALALGGGLIAPDAAEAQDSREVVIDIKPGDEPTTVNPAREGMLPVAVLSSDGFDAREIDEDSVRFAGSSSASVRSATEDVNGDGRVDRIFLFRNRDSGIQCGDEQATLNGRTRDGASFSGSEDIRTVGCEGKFPSKGS